MGWCEVTYKEKWIAENPTKIFDSSRVVMCTKFLGRNPEFNCIEKELSCEQCWNQEIEESEDKCMTKVI